jgi:uncharacterized protein GlcG (DUF336 family)
MPRSMIRRTITLASADAVVTAARKRAGLLSVAVNVAVVDDSGLLVAFCRMDGAERPSGEIAVDKAYTAAGFGFPTHEWPGFIKDDPGLVVGIPAGIRRMIIFPGGYPLHVDHEVVGAVGVSGGTPGQDADIAEYAVRRFDRLDD